VDPSDLIGAEGAQSQIDRGCGDDLFHDLILHRRRSNASPKHDARDWSRHAQAPETVSGSPQRGLTFSGSPFNRARRHREGQTPLIGPTTSSSRPAPGRRVGTRPPSNRFARPSQRSPVPWLRRSSQDREDRL
jgi:hypothetical protein